MNYFEAMSIVSHQVSEKAMIEQLAEECAELSQSALKHIRAIGNGNPTPKTPEETWRSMVEEFNDICLIANIIGLEEKAKIKEGKMIRWANRIIDDR